MNHIVGDKVYITYLNQVYNLRKESTFEYKGKEYNLQYAVLADNSKEVITLENRLKELLTDLGFIGVYNSNEAYKTFEKYLYSIISNKTGGVFIKAMNKAAYKTLVLDVICEYIKQYSPNHTFNIETGLFETI